MQRRVEAKKFLGAIQGSKRKLYSPLGIEKAQTLLSSTFHQSNNRFAAREAPQEAKKVKASVKLGC